MKTEKKDYKYPGDTKELLDYLNDSCMIYFEHDNSVEVLIGDDIINITKRGGIDMPFYDYKCSNCGTEAIKLNGAHTETCVHCLDYAFERQQHNQELHELSKTIWKSGGRWCKGY